MDRWLKDHRDWLVDFLRIYLGGVLIYKGLEFLYDTTR
ncbi:hypothetical protein LEP1GSC088_4532 [Leptospira interrogans str. L1207]|nr:hypothetical protein LEP1GSC088_4532 [Leptospira interrogans str. L1207]